MLYIKYEFYIWGSRTVSVFRLCAHNRVVVFYTLYIGQRDTIICPYLITCDNFYPLPLPQLRVFSVLSPLLYFSIPSSSASAAAAVYLSPLRSTPSCYHHHSPNHGPFCLSAALQRSRISCITI